MIWTLNYLHGEAVTAMAAKQLRSRSRQYFLDISTSSKEFILHSFSVVENIETH